jgi:hypothetical protein
MSPFARCSGDARLAPGEGAALRVLIFGKLERLSCDEAPTARCLV